MFVPLSLLFFLSYFYRSSSAVIASDLMHDLSLTATDLGFLSSAFFYSFALIQIPMGAAIDLFGPRRLLLFLSSVGIIGVVIFSLAPTFSVALLGRALLGFGMACGLMGPLKLFTVWFSPGTFATVSAVFASIGFMGNIVATAPLAAVVDWIGWRKSFLLFALIHLVINAWIYAVVKDQPESSKKSGSFSAQRKGQWTQSIEGIGRVFRLPSLWFIALSSFIRYGTYISIAGLWAGPYLEHIYTIPLVARGRILMAFPIGFTLGGPVYGLLSDRVFKTRKWVASMGTIIYALFILPLIWFFTPLYLGQLVIIFFGIGFFSACMSVVMANIKELLPSTLSGTAMTSVNFFSIAGAAVFQHIMGAMIDRFSLIQGQISTEAFSFAFGFCFISAAIGGMAYLFVKDTRV